MKTTCLFLFIALSSAVKAHEIHILLKVLDGKTRRPVPNTFVNVKLKPMSFQSDNSDKRFYYRADTAGKIVFVTDKLKVTDTITVSSLDYQTQVLRVKDVYQNQVINLIPLLKPQFDVNHNQVFKVGSEKKSGKYYNTIIDPGYENAMYMHGSQEIQGIIQTVGFYLSDGKGDTKGDVTAPFRIRLFKIDTAGAPGTELTKDIIVTSAKKSNTWCDIDISAYNIESPCEGFYVAFSLLDSGYYRIKKGAPTLDAMGKPLEFGAVPANILMPRLMDTEGEFGIPESYFSLNRSLSDLTRQWQKEYYNKSYLIRATISVPEYQVNRSPR